MQKYLPSLLDEFTAFLNAPASCNPWKGESCGGVTIGETDDAVVVEVPIPGVAKDRIEVSLEKGSLLVKAEEKEEKSEMKYHLRSERSYAYRIAIPARIDEQAAPEAQYRDGILKVKFHKSRSARPHKIEIK
jgi:HSP20 family protein